MTTICESKQFWSCQMCSYVNSDNAHLACQMCRSPRNLKRVSNSSLQKSDTSLGIDITGMNLKDDKATQNEFKSTAYDESYDSNNCSFAVWSDSDRVEWKCQLCTYMNKSALHLTCDMCGNARPSSENDDMNFSQDLGNASYSTLQAYVSERSSRKQEERLMKARLKEISKHQDQLWEETKIE